MLRLFLQDKLRKPVIFCKDCVGQEVEVLLARANTCASYFSNGININEYIFIYGYIKIYVFQA